MSHLYSFHNNQNTNVISDGSELDFIENFENMDINNENDNFLGEEIKSDNNKTTEAKNLSIPRRNKYRKTSESLEEILAIDDNTSKGKENVIPMKATLKRLNLKQATTRFFVVKSDNLNSIEMSYDFNIWCTTLTAGDKLSKAYDGGKNRVILYFSLNLSGKFYGAAELKSDILKENQSFDIWGIKQKHRREFKVEWLIYKPVANRVLRHVVVSANDQKPITSLKNGSEIISFNKGVEVLDIMFRYVDF